MSGGLAFVYDEKGTFEKKINPAMIGLERIAAGEEGDSLRSLIALHFRLTGSPHAQKLVENWDASLRKFHKVVPHPPTPDFPKRVYAFDAAKVPVAAV
jgi:glutamate synthase (NADPH/NADH) large chain/glutamate synthase (ferredoxin)